MCFKPMPLVAYTLDLAQLDKYYAVGPKDVPKIFLSLCYNVTLNHVKLQKNIVPIYQSGNPYHSNAAFGTFYVNK